MSEPFLAEIRIFAGNFAPRGWSFCGGQLLPISQNTALFSLIGTTYGGDGRTTTALPNLQGRAAMHPGRGPGLTTRRLGERGGSETVTLSEAQMPSHTHAMRASSEQASVSSPVGGVLATTVPSKMPYATASASNLVPMNLGGLETKGGGQAHNNMQPYLALNFIMALTGLFPSRG
ncbi:phage tail protein [Arcticibacterium luteifluviistationis]|uniref:Phage tail protein n=1 Tax=Arcticibacterium luteifluviistationis TaxID=1784714 RepID=A0A2Z4GDX3_9BACT|nr:tail fiber protein [Arcticibacterium luteifluviistationis]AWV99374.1 phage tail protein [Arcticibacterium luteifluviistationis]